MCWHVRMQLHTSNGEDCYLLAFTQLLQQKHFNYQIQELFIKMIQYHNYLVTYLVLIKLPSLLPSFVNSYFLKTLPLLPTLLFQILSSSPQHTKAHLNKQTIYIFFFMVYKLQIYILYNIEIFTR